RLRRPRVSARLFALRQSPPRLRRARELGGRRGVRARPGAGVAAVIRLKSLVKGSLLMPEENDSPFLLDKHRRGLQNLDRMARYPQSSAVDLLVVGAGAGGITLAQRLARAGWKVVILEKGPFWDPDRDWVSDEA